MDSFEKKCRIERNDVMGRYVVASRDIKTGETVLLENPFFAMATGAAKRCSSCFKLASNKVCSACNVFPLCDYCNEHDAAECQLLVQMPEIDISQLQKFPELLGPLKCLLLGENPATANDFQSMLAMEAHQEKRRNSEVWSERTRNIVDPIVSSGLLKYLRNLEGVDAEKLHQICGVIDVNCFELRAPDVDSLRAIYLKAALLSHDCMANTSISIDTQRQMKIYATRDINENEIISFCYTNPLLGTAERRKHLYIGKYFHCSCARCDDPTELGTHMSSLRCHLCLSQGTEAYIVCEHSKEWRCQLCSHVMDAEKVERLLEQAKEETVMAKNDIRIYELLIAKLSRILHPNHYLIIDLKQNVAAILRSIILNLSHRPGRQVFERKVRLCEDILQVMRIVQPYMSRMKAIVLYEMSNSLGELGRLRFDENDMSAVELLELLQKSESLLRESVQMLIYEPIDSPEGQLTRSMLIELKDLQNEMKLLKMCRIQNSEN